MQAERGAEVGSAGQAVGLEQLAAKRGVLTRLAGPDRRLVEACHAEVDHVHFREPLLLEAERARRGLRQGDQPVVVERPPVARLVTRTTLGSCSVGCAAVRACMS